MSTLGQKTLLIVDDDEVFLTTLARVMTRRNVQVLTAMNSEQAMAHAAQADYALIDLRIGDESGLALVSQLAAQVPQLKIVMLTGYASITTAVNAIKLGAVQYLTKPADPDDIMAAFSHQVSVLDEDISAQPMSVNRLEWEHLQKVLDEHDGNVSAAARALGMHRRTLQRKLQKKPLKQ